jgi:SEC-C motif-containing protein
MRSRYTAYARGDAEYLMGTLAPEARQGSSRKETERWARESEWLGLEILAAEAGGPSDERGVVEFRARYRTGSSGEVIHHERSRFKRREGRWYYVDGDMVKAPPFVRTVPKVGRNDPCRCGSGKKHKKCCGA